MSDHNGKLAAAMPNTTRFETCKKGEVREYIFHTLRKVAEQAYARGDHVNALHAIGLMQHLERQPADRPRARGTV